ncbi:hypothetical protein ACFYZ6_35260 [Streptomyces rubiginosohelvolus]|uniref:hypothetical protein n=1 Tax=Streptomyces rubiginosohelvolus TaxID=67362 RepID=UPI00369AB7D9
MEQAEDNAGLRRVIDGRALVSRAWICRYTGAGRSTVARWYALRREQPEGLGHPERVITLDRVDFYDQRAVEAFWAAHQEAVGTGRLGVSGRRRGSGHGEATGGRPVSVERARAVKTVLEELRVAGGYRRGLAARLAREHGGSARTWERAVSDARAAYEHEERPAAPGAE